MNQCIVDTNVVIDILKGNAEFAALLSSFDRVHMPVIVLGELWIGVNRVANREKHASRITQFASVCSVLTVDAETAQIYGDCAAHLNKIGKPIPTNDVWIAALAIQYKMQLITSDKHFFAISGLDVKSP